MAPSTLTSNTDTNSAAKKTHSIWKTQKQNAWKREEFQRTSSLKFKE